MTERGKRRLLDGRELPVHANHGLRKVCGCPRRIWAKCPHPWHFNHRWKGKSYRLSLDRHAGRHIGSKTEAVTLAESIRVAIKAGTFVVPTERATSQSTGEAKTGLTFEEFGRLFVRGFSRDRGKASWDDDERMVRTVMAFEPVPGRRLGERLLGEVSEHDIEEFIRHLVAKGRAVSTRNHNVQLLRSMSRWAIRKGYRSAPFASADSDVIRRRKEMPRRRRLQPGEEDALLKAATPHVRQLIIAALETCCRQGELLSLQWGDVSLDRGEITLKAQKTKTREHRVIPISQRLRGVLEMARTGPDGEDLPPTAFVFGNEIGERQLKIKRAWQTTVLKAHGHQPVWIRRTKVGPGEPCGPRLSPASQAVYKGINLHFHDLRHEAGSRLLEAGWPVHHVQHMLGHANLSQTSTYLNPTAIGLQESMRKLDETRAACKLVANEAACDPRPVRKADSEHPDNLLIH